MAKNNKARNIVRQREQVVRHLTNRAIIRLVDVEEQFTYLYDQHGVLDNPSKLLQTMIEETTQNWLVTCYVFCRDQQGEQYIKEYELKAESPCKRRQMSHSIARLVCDVVEKEVNPLHFLTIGLAFTINGPDRTHNMSPTSSA